MSFLSVLHPGLKLDYFRIQEWEEKWIDVAENLVCEEYISEFENRPSLDDSTQMADEVSNLLSCPSDSSTYASREATTMALAIYLSARSVLNEVKSTCTYLLLLRM
jgi:hypothetical protein